jgi:biopolymer transport protein ExbD
MKRKAPREIPEISTASLPDIIFILLFFFMVVTVMRTETPQLSATLPSTSYATRFAKAPGELSVRLGLDASKVEVDGSVVKSHLLSSHLQQQLASFSDSDRQSLQVVLHGDRAAKMVDIVKVKSALQAAGLRNLRYISNIDPRARPTE